MTCITDASHDVHTRCIVPVYVFACRCVDCSPVALPQKRKLAALSGETHWRAQHDAVLQLVLRNTADGHGSWRRRDNGGCDGTRVLRARHEGGRLRLYTNVGIVHDAASSGGKSISGSIPVHVGRIYVGTVASTTAAAFRALVHAIDHGGEEDETEQGVVPVMVLLVPVPPGLKAHIVLVFSMWWTVMRPSVAQRMKEMSETRW